VPLCGVDPHLIAMLWLLCHLLLLLLLLPF
jgi:hypothetical protein